MKNKQPPSPSTLLQLSQHLNQPLDDLHEVAASYGFNGGVSDKLSLELVELLSEEFSQKSGTQPHASDSTSPPLSGKSPDFSLPELWNNDPGTLSGGLSRSRQQVARLEGFVEAAEFLQEKDAAFEETILNHLMIRRQQLDAASSSLLQRWRALTGNSQKSNDFRQNQESVAIQHEEKLEAEFAALKSQQQKFLSPKK